jgi:hypothetical protein
MSFLTYDALVTEIGDWLARDDMDEEIKNFIWLTECDVQRRMRFPATDAIFSGTSIPGEGFITLPEDYNEGVRLDWVGDDTLPSLELATRDTVFKAISPTGNNPVPSVGDVYGDKLYIGPAPEATGFDLYYKRGTVHLGSNMPTNVILREYPDTLLHGALTLAGAYLKDPERTSMHRDLYSEAVVTARKAVDKGKWGPGVLRMKPSVASF